MTEIAQLKAGDRVRVVIEGPVHERHGITTVGDSNIAYVTGIGLQSALSVEILEPPKPEWVQGDVVVVNATSDTRFTLVRQAADHWVCSKESPDAAPHTGHKDGQVNYYLDNGRATVLIAGGRVVTPE